MPLITATTAAVPLPAAAAELGLPPGLEDLTSDPTVLALGAFGVLGVGLFGVAISALGGEKKGGVKATSAAAAFEALAEEERAVIVDIRASGVVRKEGSPDVRATKKRLVLNPKTKLVKGEEVEVEGWVEKFAKLKAIKEDSLIILIDADGLTAPTAASALLSSTEYDTVYYVTGGCEAWKAAELPYKEAFNLDLKALASLDLTKVAQDSVVAAAQASEKLVQTYEENPTIVNGIAVGVAAVGGSALLFTELETILQIVGVLGAVQFLAKRLLFAKDREATLRELKELFTEKIDAGEASRDLQRLADAIIGSNSVAELEEDVSKIVTEEVNKAEGLTSASVSPPPQSGDLSAEPAAEPVKGATAVAEAPADVAPPAEVAGTSDESDSAKAKEDRQKWIAAWKEASASASAASAEAGAAPDGSDAADAKADRQKWIAAWKKASIDK